MSTVRPADAPPVPPSGEVRAARDGGAAAPLSRYLFSKRATFLSFLRRRVRSSADADDLFQQALVKAAAHAGDLQDPAQTLAWFYSILRRTLADHVRGGAAHEAKLAAFAEAAEDAEPSPVEVAMCACSLGQLERLRPEYADILRHVDIEEQPLSEAAVALGITPNNAGVRLHRARKALREELQAFCGVESMRACLDCGCD